MFDDIRIFSNNAAFLLFFGAKITFPVFIAIQLLAISKVKNTLGNRWMAFLVLLLGIMFVADNEFFATFGIQDTVTINRFLYIHLFALPSIFLYTVYCYAYGTRRLTLKQKLFHIIPPAIDMTLVLVRIYDSTLSFNLLYVKIIDALFLMYVVFCLYRAYKIVKDHQLNIKDIHSTDQYVDMAWLYNVVRYAPIVIPIQMLLTYPDSYFFYDLADILLLSFVCYIGLHAVQQKELHPRTTMPADVEKTPRMDENKRVILVEQIAKFMNDRKPYKDVDLTMPQLASMLHISNHDLSHILNNHFNENFYGFINRHRIDESKRIMFDPIYSHLSIEGVALEAGFRSKSTFYKWFRDLNGLSPKEYMLDGSK